MSLLARTTDLHLRRLTRTAARPRLRVPVYLTLAVLGSVGSGWFSISGYHDAVVSSPTARSFTALIALAIAFLTAGPVIMVTSSARDRSQRFQRSVASLPLSPVRLARLVWGPPAIFAAAATTWLALPTLFTMLGCGLALSDALAYTGVALSLGGVAAILPLLLTRAVLRGDRWGAVRPAVAYLLWTGIVIIEFVSAFDALQGRSDPLAGMLLLPSATSSLVAGAGVDPLLAAVTAALAIGAAALAAIVLREGSSIGLRQRAVVPWRGRSRVIGELLYVLREPNTVANVLAALVLCAVVVVVLRSLPHDIQPRALPLGVALVCTTAAVPCRGFRSLFPARATAAQLLGMARPAWLARQFIVAAIVFAVTALPILAVPDLATSDGPAIAVAAAAAALGGAIAVGAALVLPVDNAIGQAAGALITVGTSGAADALALRMPTTGLALATGVAVLVAGCAIAAVIETARWHYRSPREHGRHRAAASR